MTLFQPTSTQEFLELLRDNHRLAVDFGASWCQPCKQAKPGFEQLARDHPEVACVLIDIDDPELADVVEHFQVTSVPLFVVIEENAVTFRSNGYNPSSTFDEMRKSISGS